MAPPPSRFVAELVLQPEKLQLETVRVHHGALVLLELTYIAPPLLATQFLKSQPVTVTSQLIVLMMPPLMLPPMFLPSKMRLLKLSFVPVAPLVTVISDSLLSVSRLIVARRAVLLASSEAAV